MCGIVGFTGKGNEKLIRRMTRLLKHRGPDDEGYSVTDDVTLANVRLSIIDVTGGHQPVYNEDKTIVIVYNGEIYNYQLLRENLMKRGHVFQSESDTEILVHLYEEEGMNFLNRLSGIFAFALWDVRQKKLFLVRDQIGVKPLHYFFDGRVLVFASEIKAMLIHPEVGRSLDYESLHKMLNWRFVIGEKTLFRDIKKVMPGHYLEYSNRTLKHIKYWNISLTSDQTKPDQYYIERTRELFEAAVKRNMVSDVPVGVFLSGGIDSTALVGVMSKYASERIKTFTLGFGTPEDENAIAQQTATTFGTEHHSMTVNPNPLKLLPRTIWYSETPKINIIQNFLIAQFAASKVKVALSGQGGDELFGGQINYDFVNLFKTLHSALKGCAWRFLLGKLQDILFAVHNRSGHLRTDEYRRGLQMLLAYGDRNRYYSILRNVWDYNQAFYRNIYAHPEEMLRYNAHEENELYFTNPEEDFLNQVLLCELKKKLVEDGLHIEDRMSMAWSLESRVPYLDKDLVEYCLNIPAHLKIRKGVKKYVFKEALKDIIPPHIMNRPKRGFGFNPYLQFQKDLKFVAEKVLNKEKIVKQGIFNYAYIHKIMNYPPHFRLRWHYFFLWNLVGFQIWYDMFLMPDPNTSPNFSLENYYV